MPSKARSNKKPSTNKKNASRRTEEAAEPTVEEEETMNEENEPSDEEELQASAETDEDHQSDDEDDEDDDEEEETATAGESTSNGAPDANGTAAPTKRKRRVNPNRQKPGKRQVVFDCSGNVELVEDDSKSENPYIRRRGKSKGEIALIVDTFKCTMPQGEDQSFDEKKGLEEAKKYFTEKYGEEPEVITGPFYFRMGTQQKQPTKKRDRIDVRIAEDAEFISRRAHAIHKVKDVQWKVMINYTTKENVVFAFYQSAVDPQDVARRQKDGEKIHKPGNGFVRVEALDKIEPIQKSAPNDQQPSA